MDNPAFQLRIARDGESKHWIELNGSLVKLLVAVCINQLHVHPHLVAGAADAAFENVRNPELLADLANIRSLAAITHDGSARDHFELTDFREVGQNVILHSISKEGVLLVVAQILEWQYRDRFVQLACDRAGKEKKTGGRGNDHAGGDEHNDIAATMCSRHGDRRRRFYTLRSHVESPGQDESDRKSAEQ